MPSNIDETDHHMDLATLNLKPLNLLIFSWLEPTRRISLFRIRTNYYESGNIISDRSPIIQLPGRVCEIIRFWQILLVNPPLQESG